jgi:toxin-antitoxin system PIN domain toxin
VTRALLDVNVLLALLDSDHVDHRRAWDWADEGLQAGWASCAITENGFVRIISQPRYPSPISCHQAIELLRATAHDSDHEFWTCEVSLLDPAAIASTRIHGARQLADAYLVALAARHGGRFVTFDQRITLEAVPGAEPSSLLVL